MSKSNMLVTRTTLSFLTECNVVVDSNLQSSCCVFKVLLEFLK